MTSFGAVTKQIQATVNRYHKLPREGTARPILSSCRAVPLRSQRTPSPHVSEDDLSQDHLWPVCIHVPSAALRKFHPHFPFDITWRLNPIVGKTFLHLHTETGDDLMHSDSAGSAEPIGFMYLHNTFLLYTWCTLQLLSQNKYFLDTPGSQMSLVCH